jgi:methylaspartate mutase epsilon subunit
MPHISSNLTAYDTAGFKVFTMAAQCLLGGEQGLKQIYLENGLNMNIIQDAAMIRTSTKLCEEYSKKFGYDMKFIAGSFPYLGAWPPRVEEASAMVAWNTMVSILAGATPLMLKCQDEAFATPTKEGMAASVRISRMVDRLAGEQRTPESPEFLLECEMLEKEVRTWLDYTLEAGDGDIAVGLCRGVDEGFVDTMVTPWIHMKKGVRLMRDVDNAVRYLDTGNLPLPQEVKDYHKEKLLSREKKEGRPCDFKMVISDLQFASRLY